MTWSGYHRAAKPLACIVAMLALSGCMSIESVESGRYEPDRSGRYATPIGGAPAIANETPYSEALRCMAAYTALRPLRIAVGEIADYTGAQSESGGRKITQGAALMAMSALAKAGVPLVERFDTSIADLEVKYADHIGDRSAPPGADRNMPAGSIPGSNYYIVGGITELNFNVYSEAGSIAPRSGAYVMNIGLDLRLVDTGTLEVADIVSYQKQIVGYREQPGVVEFLGHDFFAGGGDSALEPIQLAVRSMVERAVLEMMSRLYRAPPHSCASAMGTPADPLAGPGDRTGAPARATSTITQDQSQDDQPPESDRFYRSSDSRAEPHLRRQFD
jgi:curli production assembly/transport component CsgG/holdfast attachment protein HfaB